MHWTFTLSEEKLELLRDHGAKIVTGSHGILLTIQQHDEELTIEIELPEGLPQHALTPSGEQPEVDRAPEPDVDRARSGADVEHRRMLQDTPRRCAQDLPAPRPVEEERLRVRQLVGLREVELRAQEPADDFVASHREHTAHHFVDVHRDAGLISCSGIVEAGPHGHAEELIGIARVQRGREIIVQLDRVCALEDWTEHELRVALHQLVGDAGDTQAGSPRKDLPSINCDHDPELIDYLRVAGLASRDTEDIAELRDETWIPDDRTAFINDRIASVAVPASERHQIGVVFARIRITCDTLSLFVSCKILRWKPPTASVIVTSSGY